MVNSFIESLGKGSPKIGLWQSLSCAYTAEICAQTGYDWLLIDGEHSPNTAQTLLGQLQAIGQFDGVYPMARVPAHDDWIIKQYLDIGFSTLLVPMVESKQQAEAIVAATRFPPAGVRGVASVTCRAANFGLNKDYLHNANDNTGVIAQIESVAGLAAIEEIATVEGIDALFIGPGDLSAALGRLGNAKHEDVQKAIDDAIDRVIAIGKPCGIFALDTEDAKRRISQGVSFVSIGTDIGLLIQGAISLRRKIL